MPAAMTIGLLVGPRSPEGAAQRHQQPQLLQAQELQPHAPLLAEVRSILLSSLIAILRCPELGKPTMDAVPRYGVKR